MVMPLLPIVTVTGSERRLRSAVTQPRSGRRVSGMLIEYTHTDPSINKSVTGA